MYYQILKLLSGQPHREPGDPAAAAVPEAASAQGRRGQAAVGGVVPLPVGGLQGQRKEVLLKIMAGETRAHARGQVRVRMHRQRVQNEVQLTGKLIK